MMGTREIFVLFSIVTMTIGCVMEPRDTPEEVLLGDRLEEDSLDALSSAEVEEDQDILAPSGSWDYSYYSAIDVCHLAYEDEDNDDLFTTLYRSIVNYDSDETLYLFCGLPAVFYYNVGYSSDEIGEIRIYGTNRNNDDEDFFEIELYSAETSAYYYSTIHGSREINYSSSNVVQSVSFSDPEINFTEPYIFFYVTIPHSDVSTSRLYGFRVYHDEDLP